MKKDAYIKINTLYKWIEQENEAWGDDYDIFQLLKDIEDDCLPTIKSRNRTDYKKTKLEEPCLRKVKDLSDTDTMQDLISNRIQTVIRESGLTIRQAQLKCNMCGTTIYNWVKKKYFPSGFGLIQFCNFFGVSADWILGLKEERE